MAVDDPGDLGVAALERLGVDELLDEVRRLRADDVAADELAVLLVADDLDDAGAVPVDGAGADRAVVDLAHHDVDALLAGLLLGEAERADRRGAERGARDVDVLDRVRLQPGGVLDGDHAFVGGLVGERRAEHQVADRVDALGRGPQRAVDLDQPAVEGLEQQHLGAEAAVRGGDLRAGRARAHHGQLAGQLLQGPRALRADHAAAELRAGDRPGDRAGGEHDGLARLDIAAVDGHLAVAGQAAGALDEVDLVLLEQAGDAAGEGLDHLGAAVGDPREVDGALGHGDAEVVGLVDLGEHVGHAEHGLGGDAGVVEAAAADGVVLDHGGAHPELGGADGGDVAAGSGADDDAVVGAFGHRPGEASGQKRRTAASRNAARAAAWPGTPCTAPPGKVAALPRNRPRTGVRYGFKLGSGRNTVWSSEYDPAPTSPPSRFG